MTKHVDWYNATGERYCTGCRAYMALDLFHRNRASTAGDGYQRICRLCTRVYRHVTYERNRARENAYALAWQAAHPERTRETRRLALRVNYRLRKLDGQRRRIEREEQAG